MLARNFVNNDALRIILLPIVRCTTCAPDPEGSREHSERDLRP